MINLLPAKWAHLLRAPILRNTLAGLRRAWMSVALVLALSFLGVISWYSDDSAISSFGLNLTTEMLGVLVTAFLLVGLERHRTRRDELPRLRASIVDVSALMGVLDDKLGAILRRTGTDSAHLGSSALWYAWQVGHSKLNETVLDVLPDPAFVSRAGRKAESILLRHAAQLPHDVFEALVALADGPWLSGDSFAPSNDELNAARAVDQWLSNELKWLGRRERPNLRYSPSQLI